MKEDPTRDLQEAMHKLSEFNRQNSAVHGPSLEKTIGLVRSYFTGRLAEKKRARKKSWSEVRRAIDLLKSHYRLIDKLKNGSLQEQKLAASIFAAIEQYNTIIDKAAEKPKNIHERIAHFLLEESGRLLPHDFSKIYLPKSVTPHTFDTASSEASRKVSQLNSVSLLATPVLRPATPHLSHQAVELFHMKAISLIERQGLLSNHEARSAMRKAHLKTQLDPQTGDCSILSHVSPFPGHTIAISGVFEKDLPKNNSFNLTFTASHSGFPYPCQYTGWALADLLPPYPHRLEELPLFAPLYQRKQQAMQRLEPHQESLTQAKRAIDLKKKAAEHSKEHFLALQQELCLALATPHPKAAQAIEPFFAKLKAVHHFFDYYAETHQIIAESFCAHPFAALESVWIARRAIPSPLSLLTHEADRARAAFILQRQSAQSELEKAALDFILAMGSILAPPSHTILLQHFSESRFPPPMLNDFEQKLQAALIRQQRLFLEELDHATSPPLLDQIQADIALFRAPSFESIEESDPDAQLVKELEIYFNTRHYMTLN